jgi:hypothetical protein
MTQIIKSYLSNIKPFIEFFNRIETSIAAKWVKAAHKRQKKIQWSLPPEPEHFDHYIDLFFGYLSKPGEILRVREGLGKIHSREGMEDGKQASAGSV